MSADEIRDALAATLAQSNEGGMTCMDTHDARAFLADRDQWKARADKAEAEVARLREAAVKLDSAVAEYLDAEHLWQNDQCAVSVVNAAEAAMKSALYEARKTRAALEANDAGR